MKRLILLLALLAPAVAMAGSGPKGIYPPANPKVAELFQIACELSELDCTDVMAPFVMIVDTGNPLGFHIRGTNIVFMSEECFGRVADWTKCDGILVHEIVHYIASELGLFEDDSCANEALAWRTFNRYVTFKGRRGLRRLNWSREYPECRR